MSNGFTLGTFSEIVDRAFASTVGFPLIRAAVLSALRAHARERSEGGNP